MKGLIHCHSENSRYDSAMNVKTLCEQAKKLGYEAVTLTDHGTLTGIDDFVAAAKSAGIKPIPGVEAYIQEDGSAYKRLHLILLAKDDLGYQGISKAVSESNKRIDEHGFPRMNRDILKKYFGPKAVYHGHVVATSACVGGVLAGLLLSPLEFSKEISKLKKRQDKYENPESETYKHNLEVLREHEETVKKLVEQRERLNTLSKKPYKKKEKELEKLKVNAAEEEYNEKFEALQKEKEETEQAKKCLEEVRVRISETKKNVTLIKDRLKTAEEAHRKYMELQDEIDRISKNMISVEDLYTDTLHEAKAYDEIFGHGNFYVEMQYHGYLTDDGEQEIEKLVMPVLLKLADELSIPIVAANDAHIADNSQESLRARQIICSLRYASKGYISDVRKGDDQIYLKSEEEMKTAMEQIIPADRAEEAIQNAYEICKICNCEFKTGSHYPKFQSLLLGESADDALRRMALNGIEKRFPGKTGWTNTYKERLEYELQVIADMGYSDYFLIVQDFLEFGRKLGHLSEKSLEYLKENVKSMTLKTMVKYVDNHQEELGFAVGAGRGSAAGSLVAYLVGITNIVDPLKYDLLFERFLNKDRVSMPETSGI